MPDMLKCIQWKRDRNNTHGQDPLMLCTLLQSSASLQIMCKFLPIWMAQSFWLMHVCTHWKYCIKEQDTGKFSFQSFVVDRFYPAERKTFQWDFSIVHMNSASAESQMLVHTLTLQQVLLVYDRNLRVKKQSFHFMVMWFFMVIRCVYSH